jgi:hypothetical protein
LEQVTAKKRAKRQKRKLNQRKREEQEVLESDKVPNDAESSTANIENES